MKCKSCKSEFEPIYRKGILLSCYCLPCLIKKGKKKRDDASKKEISNLKAKLKTHSDWLKDLQKVFNAYIRERDKNKPCISCGRSLVGKFDAGHFFSVGAYPNLRFNEDNVFGQCVACNQHKHGNINEYSIQLPLRIGQEKYDALLEKRSVPLKLSTIEIQELIAEYKRKLKEIK